MWLNVAMEGIPILAAPAVHARVMAELMHRCIHIRYFFLFGETVFALFRQWNT